MTFLKDYTTKESVELFLVGEPRQMDNTPSEAEVLILSFIVKLSKLFPAIPMSYRLFLSA